MTACDTRPAATVFRIAGINDPRRDMAFKRTPLARMLPRVTDPGDPGPMSAVTPIDGVIGRRSCG